MNNEVHHEIALNALTWQPLCKQRKKAKAKVIFKVLNNMAPKCLSEHFTYTNEKSNYDLRDCESKICLPQPRTNSMKKSFIYNGAFIWNSLPKEIRESSSLTDFSRKIATHMF